MSVPSNITREHLLEAIKKIDSQGIPDRGHSSTYDVLFNSKRYPPKLVVSYANEFANGEILDRSTFHGGPEKPAFNLLEDRGFQIVLKKEEKMEDYYNQLMMFLEQAETNDLKTKHYQSHFKGLKVKVSFGQGVAGRIPWISFLKEPNTTSKGIYPAYLLYKDLNKLIMTYGVSETNEPHYNWKLTGKKTISTYFREKGWPKPDRYGGSYVCNVYDTENLPDRDTINKDLNLLIAEFNTVVEEASSNNHSQFNSAPVNNSTSPMEPKTVKNVSRTFYLANFKEKLKDAGLLYSDQLVERFVASLLTKPFVILTGLSGSGKTKLAQAFTQWICGDQDQYCIVPVGADWTNREPLLGYPNALNPSEYVKPDNEVLDLLISASQNPEFPYFLILDEMNLSHVERYFADFLSVMESKESIPLYAEGTVQNGVPADLKLPKNLFIIGTVNIDETTNMFSPKVLDRANTIEFRVDKTEMEGFLNNIRDINMKALEGKGAAMGESFLEMAGKANLSKAAPEINSTLVKFFGELSKTGAEFGYRSATEILKLISQLERIQPGMSTEEKLDIAIMQKLLPKLHGSRRKLVPVLSTLASFCWKGDSGKVQKEVFENKEFQFNNPEVLYPLSLEKIYRMYHGAVDNGFASFAEA